MFLCPSCFCQAEWACMLSLAQFVHISETHFYKAVFYTFKTVTCAVYCVCFSYCQDVLLPRCFSVRCFTVIYNICSDVQTKMFSVAVSEMAPLLGLIFCFTGLAFILWGVYGLKISIFAGRCVFVPVHAHACATYNALKRNSSNKLHLHWWFCWIYI